jgi:hypothetical protein
MSEERNKRIGNLITAFSAIGRGILDFRKIFLVYALTLLVCVIVFGVL